MKELSAQQQVDLERDLAEERERWEAKEKSDAPVSEDIKTFRRVFVELKYYGSSTVTDVIIAQHAQAWVRSRNPFHVDFALHLCSTLGISPPPSLLQQAIEVSRLRLRDGVAKGTANEVLRNADKNQALTLMVLFVAAGLSQKDAAIKAAGYLFHSNASYTYKASSLLKYYKNENCRQLEELMRAHYATPAGTIDLAEFQQLIPFFPDAPADLVGERR